MYNPYQPYDPSQYPSAYPGLDPAARAQASDSLTRGYEAGLTLQQQEIAQKYKLAQQDLQSRYKIAYGVGRPQGRDRAGPRGLTGPARAGPPGDAERRHP